MLRRAKDRRQFRIVFGERMHNQTRAEDGLLLVMPGRLIEGEHVVTGRHGVARYLRQIADALEVCEAGWPYELKIELVGEELPVSKPSRTLVADPDG